MESVRENRVIITNKTINIMKTNYLKLFLMLEFAIFVSCNTGKTIDPGNYTSDGIIYTKPKGDVTKYCLPAHTFSAEMEVKKSGTAIIKLLENDEVVEKKSGIIENGRFHFKKIGGSDNERDTVYIYNSGNYTWVEDNKNVLFPSLNYVWKVMKGDGSLDGADHFTFRFEKE